MVLDARPKIALTCVLAMASAPLTEPACAIRVSPGKTAPLWLAPILVPFPGSVWVVCATANLVFVVMTVPSRNVLKGALGTVFATLPRKAAQLSSAHASPDSLVQTAPAQPAPMAALEMESAQRKESVYAALVLLVATAH